MEGQSEAEQQCIALVGRLGLGASGNVLQVESLEGGVSSDIALVTLPDRKVCVKFALPKLKVEADWFAPVERNGAEFRWLQFASELVPDNVPRLFGYDEELGGFAMEFISGKGVRNWKSDLLENKPRVSDAVAVGHALGVIHAGSVNCDLSAQGFENGEDFEALRIEPYLLALTNKHPQLANKISATATHLREARIALVHGDVSPKNILFREDTPVFLDAECATIGDPAFDVAFCLNHLLLKGIHRPAECRRFAEAAAMLLAAYLTHVEWEDPDQFSKRVAELLPLLLLARVDGKSPVEYLTDQGIDDVRFIALALIRSAPSRAEQLLSIYELETA